MSHTVLKALCAVQSDLAQAGISKADTNTFDNYKFRGIDAVLNALAPILSKHGVIIMPSVTSSETRSVTTSQGKPQQHAKVTVEYTLYDAEGDSIKHQFVGEGMDRGDKAINKACTAAYKYFLFEAFCIPVEGTPDADSESPEVAEKSTQEWVVELTASIDVIKESIASQDYSAGSEAWRELSDAEKHGIWVAPSKGGPFSTSERKTMQSTEFKNGENINQGVMA